MLRRIPMVDLSIIIPHYNSVPTLKKLLYSIPIKKNIEIIVVDDRSNKDIEKLNYLIRSIEFKHIIFLSNNTKKKGAGVCRNIGMKKAVGKWILFADADDFFVKNFYANISKYFNENFEVVFFKPQSIEIDTGMESDRHQRYEGLITNYIHNNNLESETLLRYQFFVPWSKLIRRDFLEKKGICFDEVIASNDVMFSAKTGHYMKDFHVTFDVIYCVTRGKGTLTTNTNIEVYNSRLSVYIDYCKFLKEKLNKNSYRILNINGMGMIFNALKFKLGFKKIISVYVQLRKNQIPLFNFRFINPIFVVKKVVHHSKSHLNQKRYLSNKKTKS